jgi:phage gp36-like protein
MSDSLAITLHASAAEVAGGSGTAVDLWGEDLVETRRLAELRLVVTALAGGATPSLTVAIQTSADGLAWRTADTFAAVTATGTVTYRTGDLDRYVRVSWTLSVGASATFALAGTAIEAWCTLEELATFGAAGTAISAVAKATRIQQLAAATQTARGYICRRHQAPIIRVGSDVAQAVAKLAALAAITDNVGVNPNVQATELALAEAHGKMTWLRDVSRGLAGADVTDSTPETSEGSGAVVTGATRGWGSMAIV